MMRVLKPTLCLLLIASLASACHVHRPSNDHAQEQVLYSASTSDPRTFNPLLVTDATSGAVSGNLFEGLVRINAMTTLPEPDLAESWQIEDGGKAIVFHLRHDVRWADGEPFTARDVLFTLKAIYDPRVPNSVRSTLTIGNQQINAQAPDPYTVRMILPKPFAPLLYAVAFDILPAHLLEKHLQDGSFARTWGIDVPPADVVGIGPYTLSRYVQAQFLRYQRNPRYWMKTDQGGELPKLHGQVSLIVQDQNAAYLRFLSGQTDVHDPRPQEVLDLKSKAKSLGITIQEFGLDTGSLFFAFNRNPRHYVVNGRTDPRLQWFTDLPFLQAIAHSVDKKAMIDLCLHGLGAPAISDISPENKLFHDPNLKDYAYDPALAAKLLDSAGYRLLRPGVRGDPHGTPLEFTLTTNAGNQTREQMCAIFKQDLANLGIKVNYRPLEFTTLVEKLDTTFDWDCVLIGFTGTIEPNNGANFLRSSGNLHLWDPVEPKPATPWEAEIDTLLDQGAAEMDIHKRAPYYWRIQEILHEQLPIIETVRQKIFEAYKNSLVDYRPTVWGLYRPEYIQFREQ